MVVLYRYDLFCTCVFILILALFNTHKFYQLKKSTLYYNTNTKANCSVVHSDSKHFSGKNKFSIDINNKYMYMYILVHYYQIYEFE